MNNQELLNAKTRLYSELEQEIELSTTIAKHQLAIGAFDFLLLTVQRLVKTENDILEASIEIKAIRESIEQETREVL